MIPSLRKFVFPFWLCVTVGCSAGRAPVAPGEIPPGATVTQEDEIYGQYVLSTLTERYPLERDDVAVNRVRDLVLRLADAAGAGKQPWNVFVLRGSETVNAAATRGNYVFVWTGMLRLVSNDGELAAVVAHEMGHVLANHTQPTPSEEAAQIISSIGGNVANSVVSVQGPYGGLGSLAGLLTQEAIRAIVVNPESQRKELEADHIGIFLMADAGFDPRQAISLWTTMATTQGSGADIPSFLSSHPESEARLTQLEQLLPAATERYETALSFLSPHNKNTHPPRLKNDSFSFGSSPNKAAGTRWLAIEDGVVVFETSSSRARRLRRLKRDEPVTVVAVDGEWAKVVAPVDGYVIRAEIYREERR